MRSSARPVAFVPAPVLVLAMLALLACRTPRGGTGPDAEGAGASDAFELRPTATAPGDDDDDAAKKTPKWDVEHPPGPTKSVTIDTDEGTWTSLDVAPDGKTIVFDLLGDLYTLPIGGGEATSLTSGVSWDMQPRFSPNGKLVAFTSDRDGADNVWVVPVAGGAATQVTKESFRLVNSPVWSPDGQFIAVRKHFTAERSLGSGEIWLYHASGGKGVQLTDKPNDQKDVGEPAFSPDGRFVYFSQDVTPGTRFEYNKDPYAGIYAILRLDREEGHVDTFIDGPGGAVRPTPSPDGKRLAFVRRVGLRTALVVHDLSSGAERLLASDLDRDMQETWAIHGVYPAMAWTPDGKAIVHWAGGKIRKVTLADAKVTEIPFHVASTRTVSEALRTPVEVHPKTFHTKMLRWVQVAPDGKSVVYQALGHLWIRDLPGGKPRRLTRDAELEFYPSFSRDGRSIVYVAWDDDDLASIRVVARTGGRGRTITREPGHYLEPAFSPDGKTIVFRKTTGGGLVSQRRSSEPGLYAVPTRGGAATLVSRTGSDPHFGASSERVFFSDVERDKDDTKFVLRSVALTRAEPRTHVRSEAATELRVAPDGKWLAFREGFHAHIMPLPLTGRPIDIGPKAESLPVARVTKNAGEYLHWSGDSQRLHWALGPELFSRDLTDSFAFLAGAPETLPDPVERGVDIGFDVDADVPRGKIAFVGAKLVTMKGEEVIEDGVVVVDGNRIAAVGPRAQVTVPRDAKTFDVKGATIIPGIVDVHSHGPQGQRGITPQNNWLHYAMLAFGVTTVHDPSNDTGEIFAAAELARAGAITAPRIFSTGTILYGAKSPYKAVIDDIDEARAHLQRMKAVGAFSVKSYNQPRRNQRQQIIAAARELGMMVVPEGGSLFHHNMTMVVDGHTGVEHALPIARGYRDVRQLWSGTEVGYTPTLVVGYGGLWGENYWYAHTKVFAHERLRSFVPPRELDARSRRRVLASAGDWNHFAIARLAKQLLDAGVEIQLGAHGQREGLAAHWELWMFVQGGMTPHEALRAGTSAGAHYLGLDRDLGSLEVGKLADLAVIDGDVLADIRKSENVRYTMVNGRLFDARTMDELAPRSREHPRFHWQRAGG
ncbi:MAG TPA: amidohydrolase family protein [Nannocystaceae bacterium]|nr:amidohydrolase family protein [Nannocystaceae bacterium]